MKKFTILLSGIFLCCTTFLEKPPQKAGSLFGCFIGDYYTFPENPGIVIKGTKFGATVADNRKYLIQNIPIGAYNVTAVSLQFKDDTYLNVRIAEDSITILNFHPTPTVLQIEVFPKKWIETDSSIVNQNYFIQTGKMFNYLCK